MAIDSAAKRYSMLNFCLSDAVLFEVDGTVDADDRVHLLGLYGGLFDAGGAPAPTPSSIVVNYRGRDRFRGRN
jgi:hypothetical protein